MGAGHGSSSGGSNKDEDEMENETTKLLNKEPKNRGCDFFGGDCGREPTGAGTEGPPVSPTDADAQSLSAQGDNFQDNSGSRHLVPTMVQTPAGYRESEIPHNARVTNDGTKVATMKDLKGGSHEKGEIGVTDSGLFGTNLDTGLTKEENERRLGLFGFNELPEKEKNICLSLLLEFAKPMAIIVWMAVLLELVAACIEYGNGNESAGHGYIIDVVALLLLQFLNVFVGFYEELKADEAIKALKQSLLPEVVVFRDGMTVERVAGRQLTVGDIVSLAAGSAVPADGYIIPVRTDGNSELPSGRRCEVDQAAINGESMPFKAVPYDAKQSSPAALAQFAVELEDAKAEFYKKYPIDQQKKYVHQLDEEGTAEREKGEKKNDALAKKVEGGESKVLMGTMVCTGSESTMIVTATGEHTVMGGIAQMMDGDQGDGHFEELLTELLWVLVIMGILVNIIIVAYLLTLATPPPILNVLSFAVVLLIASIPIALRVVCQTTLALGTNELSKKGAIVSKMNAVEEIASMTLLCSDKTGTLTQGRMEMVPLEEQYSEDDEMKKEEATPGKEAHTKMRVWRKPGVNFDYILQHAVLAMKWWEVPPDAIDKLLQGYACKYAPIQAALKQYYEFDDEQYVPFNAAVSKRTEATIKCLKKEGDPDFEGKRFDLPQATYIITPGVAANPEKKIEAVPEVVSEHPEQLTVSDGYQMTSTVNLVNNHQDGGTFSVTKGAPHDVLKLIHKEERQKIREEFLFSVKDLGGRGVRSLAVAVCPHLFVKVGSEPGSEGLTTCEFEALNLPLGQTEYEPVCPRVYSKEGSPNLHPDSKEWAALSPTERKEYELTEHPDARWTMLGILAFRDPLRFDSEATADMCQMLGVDIKMITGDNHLIAAETCKQMHLEKRLDSNGKPKELSVVNIDRDSQGNTTPLPSIQPVALLKEMAEDKEKVKPLLNYVENIASTSDEYANHQYVSSDKEQKQTGTKSEYMWYMENTVDQDPNIGFHAGQKDHPIIRCGEISDDASAFAGVFPEHKFLIVAALQQKFGKPVGMTGDGVNDAPALHRANIGIAVEGCTDAARAAADIVLTEPGLSAVIDAIVTSRKIFQRMKNFVVYRIACTLQLLFFFLVACLAYNPQDYCATDEFFFLPVIALVTIVILNDGTIISVAFDNVQPSKNPEEWNMTIVCIVSSVVGLVALISSVILLHFGLELSGNYEASLYKSAGSASAGMKQCLNADTNFLTATGMDTTFGMDELHYNGIKTMIYLKIALSDYISLFNCRNHGWFFTSLPSVHVIVAAIFATFASSLLSRWWPFGGDMDGIGWGVIGFVWIWTLFWGLVQDACKVFTYWILKKCKYAKDMEVLDEAAVEKAMAGPKARSQEEGAKAKMKDKVVKAYYKNGKQVAFK
jgi:magnesium-transporting ATPase (P-type)